MTSPIAQDLRPVRIEEELRSSYLDYAMSVIVARALPDVRDGLKPVQRRILYAMQELGLRPGSPYKKSARIVGEVLGKYHPHGDAPVYEAMVRMAQPFTLRYPLVDGQGNFGSLDNDPPAAMRYTEARLAPMAEEMLADIDRDTVDFAPNFDGTLQEPAVLPARLPNLLVNGASGIAVGMATSIPPHNLGEVCDALIYLIDHPEATLDDLLQFIQGPDFPTGGVLLAGPDRRALREAYRTGQGRVLLRARVEVQEVKRSGRARLVITEVPYQVNKASLVERIAYLAREKQVEGISEVRDESSREGVRVVVELKGSAQPEVVLNNLYVHTPLQVAYPLTFLALVEGQPRTLGLVDLLSLFLQHRQRVITRRARHDLRKAQERAHILEGLRAALQNIDLVVRLIRESRDPESARRTLMERLSLTETQANAILEMPLRRLTALDRQKLEEEYEGLRRTIADLEALLADPRKVLEVVKAETRKLKETYADGRRTLVVSEEAREFRREEMEPHLDVVITLSLNGYIKRLPLTTYRLQHRGGKGVKGQALREEDALRFLQVADTHDTLLFFTDTGRVYSLKGYEVPPDTTRASRGTPLANLLPLQEGEKVTSLLAFPSLVGDGSLLLATRKGEMKRLSLREVASLRRAGLRIMDLAEEDTLVSARLVSEEDQVLVVTRGGRALRFPAGEVPLRSRYAGGVRGVRLSPGDRVVAVEVAVPGAHLLTITERGFGKRTPVEEFPLHHRGGKGVVACATGGKAGPVASAHLVADGHDLLLASAQGMACRVSLQEVPVQHRASRGVLVMRLESGDQVVSVAPLVGVRSSPGDGRREEPSDEE